MNLNQCFIRMFCSTLPGNFDMREENKLPCSEKIRWPPNLKPQSSIKREPQAACALCGHRPQMMAA